MIKYISNLSLNTFIFLIAISFIPGIGLYDFFTRGEGREALMVQDIVLNGDWILPRGYDNTISTKPPLLHWIGAALASLIGLSEFSIRLPSALLALLTLLLFLSLLRKDLNENGKWIFVVFLAFAAEWLRASLSARVDMVHAATLSCGILAGYYALKDNKLHHWILSAVMIGFGMLGKGPVALVLGGGILAIWALFKSQRKILSLTYLFFSLLLSLVIGGSWYLAAYLEAPTEFWEFFQYESVARFTSSMEDAPHSHSFFYLILVFVVGALPFSPYIFWLVFKNSPKNFGGIKSAFKNSDSLFLFSLLSVLVVFIFYSIPNSKRSVYLLACYPFVALSSAVWLQSSFSEKHLARLKVLAVSGCMLVLIGQVFVLPLGVAPKQSERELSTRILANKSRDTSVFSYGFEFYGASFYSGTTFYSLRTGDEAAIFKLKEQLKLQPQLKAGDLLVTFDRDIEAAQREVGKRGLKLEVIEYLGLGRKRAAITRIT